MTNLSCQKETNKQKQKQKQKNKTKQKKQKQNQNKNKNKNGELTRNCIKINVFKQLNIPYN